MDFILPFIESGALAVLISNVITMLISKERLDKAGPIVKTIIGLLNVISLNVLGNKNA